MTEKLVKESVVIGARAETIWKVLTDADFTEKYMYGCRAFSTWKEGTALTWEMIHEGKKLVAVKGTVLDFKPPRLLRYTVFDPNGAYKDVPSNHLTVTCTLTPVDGGERVDFVQGDFATVEDGERRYQDSLAGGDAILVKIKALAEGA
jgi:uncharacterized protein YndB with AHSA1/START domain